MPGLPDGLKCVSVLPGAVEPDSSDCESLRRVSKGSVSTDLSGSAEDSQDCRPHRRRSGAQFRESLVRTWADEVATDQRALGRRYMDSIATTALFGSVWASALLICIMVVGAFIAPFGHGHVLRLKNGVGSGILRISSALLCLNGLFKVIGIYVGGVFSTGNSFECSVGMLSQEATTKFIKIASWFANTFRVVFMITMGPPVAILGFFVPSDLPVPHPLLSLAAYSCVGLYAWTGTSMSMGLFMPNAWAVKLACDVVDEHLTAMVVNDDTEGSLYLQKVLLSLSCIRSLSNGFTENWEFYFLVAESMLLSWTVIWSISAVQMCQWASIATNLSGFDMAVIIANVTLTFCAWVVTALLFGHGVLVSSSCDRVVSNARSHLNERMLSRVLTMSGQSTDEVNNMSQMFENYVSTCDFGFRPYGIAIRSTGALSLFYIMVTVALGIAMNFLL